MLKVPRMLDEIDPLPALVEDRFISKEPWQQRWTSRHIQERIYDVGKAAAWTSVPGKPHLYTRNGKLKYEPPLPPDDVTKKTDVRSMVALEDALVAALRTGDTHGFSGRMLDLLSERGRLLEIAEPKGDLLAERPSSHELELARTWQGLSDGIEALVVFGDSTVVPDFAEQMPWPPRDA